MKYLTNFESEKGVEKDAQVFINNNGNVIPVFKISSFHSLTQFVGYGKYLNRKYGSVYLRGQTHFYPTGLVPSLLRGCGTSTVKIDRFHIHRNDFQKNSKHFKLYDKNVMDPLLQHYGVKTDWLDLVDNLWVALWFGIHHFDGFLVDGMQHVHVSPQDSNSYCYVFLMLVDAIHEIKNLPGICKGKTTVLVDLRKACPSVFLRPHAQHALMVKKQFSANAYNYNDLVIGVAKIKISDCLDWIGYNGLMSIQSLFPPTFYDYGYRMLLEEYKIPSEFINEYGAIQLISY